MLLKVARITSSSLIPIVGFQIFVWAIGAFAAPKERETIEIQVISSHTKIHRSSANGAFTYTDFMLTQVNGNEVIYDCAQRGDICPLMESGKTYTADREGNFIYISMTVADAERPITVRYKEAAGDKKGTVPERSGRSLP